MLTNRDEKAKRRAEAYSFIQRTVPKVWTAAEPAMRMFLTTEIHSTIPTRRWEAIAPPRAVLLARPMPRSPSNLTYACPPRGSHLHP